jgi:phosphodiesterase/alkaline phosphatase D-like protein
MERRLTLASASREAKSDRHITIASDLHLGSRERRGLPDRFRRPSCSDGIQRRRGGDMSANDAILWTRTVESATSQPVASALTAQLADKPEFRNVLFTYKGMTDSARAGTVKIVASGLKSHTRYFYRFVSDVLSRQHARPAVIEAHLERFRRHKTPTPHMINSAPLVL